MIAVIGIWKTILATLPLNNAFQPSSTLILYIAWGRFLYANNPYLPPARYTYSLNFAKSNGLVKVLASPPLIQLQIILYLKPMPTSGVSSILALRSFNYPDIKAE